MEQEIEETLKKNNLKYAFNQTLGYLNPHIKDLGRGLLLTARVKLPELAVVRNFLHIHSMH